MTANSVPGLLIAAPRSGSGKTMLTLGLLRALARRGLVVQPAKCGPDYIDPGFQRVAAGRESLNLDSWAMRPALIDALIAKASRGTDLILCEGLMGLFDGVASKGATDDGSSASIAARAGWPVVLVLDVSGQSQSAGAIAKGFASFRADVEITGVVLNQVASPRHKALAMQGIAEAGLPVLGALPRQADLQLPERHLGLVQAEEIDGLQRTLDRLADFVEAHVDLDGILKLAKAAPLAAAGEPMLAIRPPGQRIAVARDVAFSFIYPHVLAGWRKAGADILFFSPLADEAPAPGADIVWLPGGYPELHAGRLAANGHFLQGLRHFASTRPVHGECGGYMVLGESLTDADGRIYAMAGLLALRTSFAARRMQLGCRHMTLLADCVLGPAGSAFRGHEFHYATILKAEDQPLFKGGDANGSDLGTMGGWRGHVTGSFLHMIDRV